MAKKRSKRNTQQSRRRRDARRARRKQEEKRSRQRRNASGASAGLDPFGMDGIDPFEAFGENLLEAAWAGLPGAEAAEGGGFGTGIDDSGEGWSLEPAPSGSALRCSCCGALSRLRGFAPPHLDRCESPVHLDAAGRAIPDPYAILGLATTSSSEVPVAEQVRNAYLRKLREHPPELEPERHLQIREARDRLCDPARVIERELGVLHAPSAAAWGLPEAAMEDPPLPGLLGARERLLGQLVVYALVEDLLSEPIREDAVQRDLF